jgi:hypothetical protein
VLCCVDPMRLDWEIVGRLGFGRLCRLRRYGIYGGSLDSVSEGVLDQGRRTHTL